MGLLINLIFSLLILLSCNPTTNLDKSLTGSVVTEAGGASFSPNQISGLAVWLDSSSNSSLFTSNSCTGALAADSTSVGCWQDLSGNNRHATNSVVIQQPLNSNGFIQFDGQDDHYYDSHSFSFRSVFIVFRVDSILMLNTDLGQLWGYYSNVAHVAVEPRGGANLRGFSFDGSSSDRGRYSLSGGNFTSFAEDSNVTQFTYNQVEMISVEFENTHATTRQVIGTLLDTFAIGNHQFGGQIGEIVVFDRVLSQQERESIEGYLACKWSIQARLYAGHPYKTTCNGVE